MTFISIIIAIFIERHFEIGRNLRNFTWFHDLTAWVEKKFADKDWWNSWAAAFAMIFFIPVLYTLLVNEQAGFIYQLVQILVGVAILVYCLGPENPAMWLKPYFRDMQRSDLQGAFHHVSDTIKGGDDLNATGLTREVTLAIFEQANSRYFAVMFWFVLLGPFGAILYRLNFIYAQSAKNEAHRQCSARLRSILNWIPARLSAFTYALAGDFVAAYQKIREFLLTTESHTRAILTGSGLGAIQCEEQDCQQPIEENREAIALVDRALTIWLVILAVMAVVGWI